MKCASKKVLYIIEVRRCYYFFDHVKILFNNFKVNINEQSMNRCCVVNNIKILDSMQVFFYLLNILVQNFFVFVYI